MKTRKAPPAIRFLFENSLFLVGGAAVALVWANVDFESYHDFIDHPLIGSAEAAHPISIHFIVNDVLMALFFAIAAKEVWEALLPGGPLSNPRKAATPIVATFGGMIGPAAIYLLGVAIFGPAELGRGWAIPVATDIAFSYLVARAIFGASHPAIPFLLLLAIVDDALGLIILAVAYPDPSAEPEPLWLLLSVGAVLLGLFFRRLRLRSFWWYLLIPGTLSWVAFFEAHLHPALGLVPVIPTMPHARTDLGILVRMELGRHDTLNQFEHWWKNPVELILGLFGLVNAGVAFGSYANGTWFVLAGLLLGKPLGIALFTYCGTRFLGLQMATGISFRDIIVVGIIAGFGFTVALFVSAVAFPLPSQLDLLSAVKLGALGSCFSAVLAFIAARLLRVTKHRPDA